MDERSTIAEAIEAGLLAQRAQGLEPSDFAKSLALNVLDGTITLAEMQSQVLTHYKTRTNRSSVLPQNELHRSTIEDALQAGLLAHRAQGLEPPQYGKDLAAQVAAGEITLQEMEDILLARFAAEDAANVKRD